MEKDSAFFEGPLYPIEKLIHEKILGLLTRFKQTKKFFHVHAKIKAITFHIDIKEID